MMFYTHSFVIFNFMSVIMSFCFRQNRFINDIIQNVKSSLSG